MKPAVPWGGADARLDRELCGIGQMRAQDATRRDAAEAGPTGWLQDAWGREATRGWHTDPET